MVGVNVKEEGYNPNNRGDLEWLWQGKGKLKKRLVVERVRNNRGIRYIEKTGVEEIGKERLEDLVSNE